jgi:hypothetical protein
MNVFAASVLETGVIELQAITPAWIARKPQEARHFSKRVEPVPVSNIPCVQQ